MIQWLQGDCREVLCTLPAQSVHCVITSPPYWGLRDYGVHDQGGIGLEPTFAGRRIASVKKGGACPPATRLKAELRSNYFDFP